MSADHKERMKNWTEWLYNNRLPESRQFPYGFEHQCGAITKLDYSKLANVMCSGCRFELDMRNSEEFTPIYVRTPTKEETTVPDEADIFVVAGLTARIAELKKMVDDARQERDDANNLRDQAIEKYEKAKQERKAFANELLELKDAYEVRGNILDTIRHERDSSERALAGSHKVISAIVKAVGGAVQITDEDLETTDPAICSMRTLNNGCRTYRYTSPGPEAVEDKDFWIVKHKTDYGSVEHDSVVFFSEEPATAYARRIKEVNPNYTVRVVHSECIWKD